MLSPLSDVVANITLAHRDGVGRGHPLHQFSVKTAVGSAGGGTALNEKGWLAQPDQPFSDSANAQPTTLNHITGRIVISRKPLSAPVILPISVVAPVSRLTV